MHDLNADLHSHSSFSDGMLSPEKLAQRAYANGVELWSLTDHDELEGIPAARDQCDSLKLPFIAGVEISVTWANKTIHVVGLNIDPNSPSLVSGLKHIRSGRDQRALQIAKSLEKHLGIKNVYEGTLKYVSNPRLISRSHFARYLVECEIEASISQVFQNYLVEGKPGFVPHGWAKLADAINWIIDAGGVAVLAHPGRYNLSQIQLNSLIDDFCGSGGRAIETITGSHTKDQYQEFEEVARRNNLYMSRGSDFHSIEDATIDIGCLPKFNSKTRPVWQLFHRTR